MFNEEAEDMGIHLTNRAYKKDCNKMIDFCFFLVAWFLRLPYFSQPVPIERGRIYLDLLDM